jgi:hypothetical protein
MGKDIRDFRRGKPFEANRSDHSDCKINLAVIARSENDSDFSNRSFSKRMLLFKSFFTFSFEVPFSVSFSRFGVLSGTWGNVCFVG